MSQQANDGQASGLNPPGPYGFWGDSGSEKGAVIHGDPADNGSGVVGTCDGGTGVWGSTNAGTGVVGLSYDSGVGVFGSTVSGTGVSGSATTGVGVYAASVSGAALRATSDGGQAIIGVSQAQDAINGTSSAVAHAGVSANNDAPASGEIPAGFGLWASSNNTAVYARGTPAAYFDGDVIVAGDVILSNGSGDIAEDFDIEVDVDAGTVLVISADGTLRPSGTPYDSRVAGVVAGAGELRPAVRLQKIPSEGRRAPVALVGKAFCKVDARGAPIAAGDLLTTSATPGHAMNARERSRAFGAVVGKALAGLDSGLGLIPILVTLR
jgi:hypothetical protein